jgi:hypothetical protein
MQCIIQTPKNSPNIFFGFLERERYEKTTTNLMIKKQHQIYTSSSEKNEYINEKY